MTKAPLSLQDLRRTRYRKAKAEPSWRFWGLYVHLCTRETRREAARLAKENKGAPGSDGVTFEAIEAAGIEAFLEQLCEALVQQTYRPLRVRKVCIPQEGGTRQRSIPAIRDRVVQGALKLILEPIFQADFQPGAYGYRPKQSAYGAIQRVAEAILEGKTSVIELDRKAYFDHIRHHQVLAKVARRVDEAEVMPLLPRLLKAAGKRGVPQGAVHSPLLSHLYVNEAKRRSVDLRRDERFGCLGCACRRVRTPKGRWMPRRTPWHQKRTALLRRRKEAFRRHRSRPLKGLIEDINPILRSWVPYVAIGHSSRCVSCIRHWVEQKIRRHLANARQRQGFGWQRWSRRWLDDVGGLFDPYDVNRQPSSTAAPA